jgi:hypothetical protein
MAVSAEGYVLSPAGRKTISEDEGTAPPDQFPLLLHEPSEPPVHVARPPAPELSEEQEDEEDEEDEEELLPGCGMKTGPAAAFWVSILLIP